MRGRVPLLGGQAAAEHGASHRKAVHEVRRQQPELRHHLAGARSTLLDVYGPPCFVPGSAVTGCLTSM